MRERRRTPGLGGRVDRVFRRLDDRLGIDHSGRSEWIWAVPTLTLLGTLAMVMVVAHAGGLTLLAAVPLGLLLGTVMAGMSVAYMTSDEDAQEDDEGDGGQPVDHTPPSPPVHSRDEPPRTPWWEEVGPTAEEAEWEAGRAGGRR